MPFISIEKLPSSGCQMELELLTAQKIWHGFQRRLTTVVVLTLMFFLIAQTQVWQLFQLQQSQLLYATSTTPPGMLPHAVMHAGQSRGLGPVRWHIVSIRPLSPCSSRDFSVKSPDRDIRWCSPSEFRAQDPAW